MGVAVLYSFAGNNKFSKNLTSAYLPSKNMKNQNDNAGYPVYVYNMTTCSCELVPLDYYTFCDTSSLHRSPF